MTYATINTNLEAPPFKIPIYDAPGVMNSTWVRWFQGVWDRVGGPSGDSVYDAIKASQTTSATEPQLMGQFEDIRQELTGILLSIIEQVQQQFFDPSALISDVNLQLPNFEAAAFEESGLGYILSIAKEAVTLDDVLKAGNASDRSMITGDHKVNGALTATTVYANTITSNLYIGTGTQLTDLQTTALVGNLQIVNFNSGTNATSSTYWMGNGTWQPLPTPVYGEFITTSTQTLASTTGTYVIDFDFTTTSSVVTLQNNSEIHFNETGVYNVQFSAQLVNVDNNTARRAIMWFRQNGTDLENSAGFVSVSGQHSGLDGSALMSYNLFVESTSTNDYIELAWNAESTNVSVASFGPSTSAPVYPRSPAVILTVTKLRT